MCAFIKTAVSSRGPPEGGLISFKPMHLGGVRGGPYRALHRDEEWPLNVSLRLELRGAT